MADPRSRRSASSFLWGCPLGSIPRACRGRACQPERVHAPDSTRHFGHRVELRVAEYLGDQGLSVLERNVERAGAEIDLIAIDGRLAEPEYVFVEVRSRTRAYRGSPLETVDRDKQRQIVRAATAWLVERGLWESVAVRFDVVGVTVDGDRLQLSWIADAYEA